MELFSVCHSSTNVFFAGFSNSKCAIMYKLKFPFVVGWRISLFPSKFLLIVFSTLVNYPLPTGWLIFHVSIDFLVRFCFTFVQKKNFCRPDLDCCYISKSYEIFCNNRLSLVVTLIKFSAYHLWFLGNLTNYDYFSVSKYARFHFHSLLEFSTIFDLEAFGIFSLKDRTIRIYYQMSWDGCGIYIHLLVA